jgi:SAM-dependent methyltransferase
MSHFSVPAYDAPEYWEKRFQNEYEFEWLLGFEDLKTILLDIPDKSWSTASSIPTSSAYKRSLPFGPNALIQPHDRILHVGCGSSQLGVALARAGCTYVVNTDISATAIKHGLERAQMEMGAESFSPATPDHPDKPYLTWIQSDILDMRDTFANGSMDVVLDKGVLDAIACGDSDIDVSVCDGRGQRFRVNGEKTAQVVNEVGRVLRPNGRWIVISYSSNRPMFHAETMITEPTSDIKPAQPPADSGWRWVSDPVRVIQAPDRELNESTGRTVFRPPIYHYVYVHRKLPISI